MISKRTRQIVYDKYNGHCAYCGCRIGLSEMQVDHIMPKRRGHNSTDAGTDDIENLNPSCRTCNYYKGMGTPDELRKRLHAIIPMARRPVVFRLAERYGMVEVKEWDGKFYFEKMEE